MDMGSTTEAMEAEAAEIPERFVKFPTSTDRVKYELLASARPSTVLDIEYDKKWLHEVENLFEKNKPPELDSYDKCQVAMYPVAVAQAYETLPYASWRDLPLPPQLHDNVKRCKLSKLLPPQRLATPAILDGMDVALCAPTGSGKTACYGFGVLGRLLGKSGTEFQPLRHPGGPAYPQVVVLCPSRELAAQVYDEFRKFTYLTAVRPCVAYGGSGNLGTQVRELERGCDVLIGAPGRLIDFAQRGVVVLSAVRFLVIDEVDRLLEGGFSAQVHAMTHYHKMPLPEGRQTIAITATMPHDMQHAVSCTMRPDFAVVVVGTVYSATPLIHHKLWNWKAPLAERVDEMVKYIKLIPGKTIVFCRSMDKVQFIAAQLRDKLQTSCEAFSSQLNQVSREYVLEQFKKSPRDGGIHVLVATDLAQRGLDVLDVTHVINYDLPDSIEDYIHRVGRTGRAGLQGYATSFYVPWRDEHLAYDLMKVLQEAGSDIPLWLKQAAQALPSDLDVLGISESSRNMTNGHGNGHANGNANGNANGKANGAGKSTPGKKRRSERWAPYQPDPNAPTQWFESAERPQRGGARNGADISDDEDDGTPAPGAGRGTLMIMN